MRARALRDSGQRLATTHDVDAGELEIAHRGVVVEHGHDAVGALRVVLDRAHELAPGLAGTKHDDRVGLIAGVGPLLTDQAQAVAQGEHEDQREAAGHDGSTGGDAKRSQEVQQRKDESDREHRLGNPAHLFERSVVEPTAIQAHETADRDLKDARDRTDEDDRGPGHDVGAELLAQQRGHEEGQEPEGNVDQRLQCASRPRACHLGSCLPSSRTVLVPRGLRS